MTQATVYQNSIKGVKSVGFRHTASPELLHLLEEFRLMCNDATRIALQEQPKSRFSLQAFAYQKLKRYGLHSHYILAACEVAYSLYRNKSRKSAPYVGKAFLKPDNECYSLNHLLLRIPSTPRHFIFITLEGSEYHLAQLKDSTLKRGSVTITEDLVSLPLSKEIPLVQPLGYVGVDVNERNVTFSSTNGYERRFDELSEVVEIKETYKEIRAKIRRNTKCDNRICRRLLAKYGKRERSRTTQRIHQVTKEIVEYARRNDFGIKMERLTGIRRLYSRGNGQGKSFRGRMNTWVFGETQRQTSYKAAWQGVRVNYVNPRGTSRICPVCGSRVTPIVERRLFCPKCDKTWDRDVLASKNIMACAVPQARPPKGSSEKERGGEDSNPLSRWVEVGQDQANLPNRTLYTTGGHS